MRDLQWQKCVSLENEILSSMLHSVSCALWFQNSVHFMKSLTPVMIDSDGWSNLSKNTKETSLCTACRKEVNCFVCIFEVCLCRHYLTRCDRAHVYNSLSLSIWWIFFSILLVLLHRTQHFHAFYNEIHSCADSFAWSKSSPKTILVFTAISMLKHLILSLTACWIISKDPIMGCVFEIYE